MLYHQRSWHEGCFCWGKHSNSSEMKSSSEELASGGKGDLMLNVSEHRHIYLIKFIPILSVFKTSLTEMDCLTLYLKTGSISG